MPTSPSGGNETCRRSSRPATPSPVLLGLLRDELGFDGVVVTDALDMRAISAGVGRPAGAVAALAAGADLLCIGNPVFPDVYDEESAVDEVVDAIDKAVAGGALSLERLEEASARVATLRGTVPVSDPVVHVSAGVEAAR